MTGAEIVKWPERDASEKTQRAVARHGIETSVTVQTKLKSTRTA